MFKVQNTSYVCTLLPLFLLALHGFTMDSIDFFERSHTNTKPSTASHTACLLEERRHVRGHGRLAFVSQVQLQLEGPGQQHHGVLRLGCIEKESM